MSDEAKALVKDLIESGIHFGQRSSAWNPRMGRFIYGKRSGIHIIDIKETVKGLLTAKKFVAQTVASGRDVCFVGTKRQAKDVLQQRVGEIGMHWVTERWLGGTLTNFRTIRSRLKKLEELEAIASNDNFASYSKKMESQLRREMMKIKRNLDGLRKMERLPGALIVIDLGAEMTAVKEARKLGIPVVCLIDTDADPGLVDIAIPGNDDSMRSIDVVIRELCKAVAEGKQNRVAGTEIPMSEIEQEESPDRKQDRRRSRRSQFRAEGDRGGDDRGGPRGDRPAAAPGAAGPSAGAEGAAAGKP